MKKAIVLVLCLLLGFFLAGCDTAYSTSTVTYFVASGGINVGAWNELHNSEGTLRSDLSARDAYAICIRIPVISDKYRNSEDGLSHAELETRLSSILSPADVNIFLNLLDSGAAWIYILASNGDYVYIYAVEE